VSRVPPRIEGYVLLGDSEARALVSKDGSIDLLCPPRFGPAASSAAGRGNEESGSWRIAPSGNVRGARHRYRGETLVLETDFDTAEGSIRLVDFMPPRGKATHLVRLVEGVRGRVSARMHLRPRFGHGQTPPRLHRIDGADVAVAGSESVWLRTPVETRAEDVSVQADFFVSAGELVPFVLTWQPSHEPAPAPVDPLRALADTESFWTESGTAAFLDQEAQPCASSRHSS
jgi:GH15 family glucan-1,4-alpha-glucosidase